MALLNVFLQLVVWFYQLLRRTLENLLAFLTFLDRTARTVLTAVADFSVKLCRVSLSITWTLVRLALFYLPGLVFVFGFGSNRVAMIAGISYMVLISLVGLLYRPQLQGQAPVRVGVTWLAYFPLSWSQDPDFAEILARFVSSYDDLLLMHKNTGTDSKLLRTTLRSILNRLDRNLKWTNQCVKRARKLRGLQRKLKDKQMIADLEARIQTVQERLEGNLQQFQQAKVELGRLNLALDDQQRIFDSLNPIESEIVLLENFERALRNQQRTLSAPKPRTA